jgi:PAS domain S-box-containing protein
MDKSTSSLKIAELSIIYEIASLRFSESEETFAKEVIEKASRLFGVRRLALLAGEGENKRLIVSWGFRNQEEVSERIGQDEPNQFKIVFGSDGKLGTLFMEQSNKIESRELRLYTIFSQQLENALITARETAERERAEEELQNAHDALETKVKQRTTELTRANELLRTEFIERKQAEEAFVESEEKYRHLFDLAPDNIVVIDLKGKIVACNSAITELTGYSKDDFIGKGFAKLQAVHVSDIPRYMKILSSLIKGNKAKPFEISYKHKDGSLVWGEVRASVFKRNGKKKGIQTVIRDITERKRALEEITKFKTIADIAGYGVAIGTSDGLVSYVNSAFAEMHGYTPEELSGINYSSFYSEEQLPVIDRLRAQLYETGSFVNEEVWHIKKDGTAFPTIMTGNLIRDNEGKPLYTVGSTIDITERKKMEVALKESEAKFRELAEKSPNMVFINKRGKITFTNAKAEKITGYTREELYSPDFDFRRLIAPESMERVEYPLAQHMKGKNVPSQEYIILNKNGKRLNVLITTALIPYEGETAILGNITDISDLKKAQRKVQESEEKLRQIFESVSDGVFLTDNSCVITECNSGAVQVFGLENKSDLLGRRAPKFIAQSDRDRMFSDARNTIIGGESYLHEYNFTRADGSIFPGEISGSVLRDASGSVTGYVAVIRDITGPKKMQEQMMITDRLASIGELAAGIAHELNNPLTGIIGFSELLQRKQLPEDIKSDLDIIDSEAKRTAHIVRNLLAFARRHPQEKHAVDINKAIQEILELRSYQQKTHNIKVKTEFVTDLPEVMANAFQLQQVFMNIIINAEHFMTEAHDGGNLTISSRRIDHSVQISIADDGPGMSKENLQHVFDPFFTTKEVRKGTGLGLSICHGIINEHGGYIYAESELGKGATFFVELPVFSEDQGIHAKENKDRPSFAS